MACGFVQRVVVMVVLAWAASAAAFVPVGVMPLKMPSARMRLNKVC